jgi:hypothetical protein
MNSTANPTFGDRYTLQTLADHKTPSVDERVRRAVARIEASRSALVVCLAPDPPKRHGHTSGDAGDAGADMDPNLSLIDTLKARIERNGLVQGSWRTVRTLARRWWTRQSWHRSVDLVVSTLAHEARPLIRNHPLAALAVGAALGAALVAVASAVRPWAAHRMRGNNSTTWRGRVGNLLWSQFSSAPMQMALAGALTAWVADQGMRRKAQSAEPPGETAPHSDSANGAFKAEASRSAL